MNINKKVLSLLTLSLMIFSTGNARYKSMPLKKQSEQVKKASNSVTYNYKVFTKKDCKKYLNSKDIINKGYQPIQLTITNNGQNDVALSLSDFNVSCISSQEVANVLHRNMETCAKRLGIGSLFFSPLIIGAVVQAAGANDYNDDMDKDFSRKELKSQTIGAGKSVTGLVFVSRQDSKNNLILTLQNPKENKSITTVTSQDMRSII